MDVVAKVTTGEYAKCIRRDGAHLGPSHSVPDFSNGYLCGESFFSDETIQKSLTLAQENAEGNPNYPSPYFGPLYPGYDRVLIWPILRGKILYKVGAGNYLSFLHIFWF